MINIDTIYSIFTPILGAGSIVFTVKAFLIDNIPASLGTDVSPIAIIISLIGTFVLGLMRITNSVKNVEETNNKMLTTLTQLLDSNAKLIAILADDSKKQDKLLENHQKMIDLENKTLEQGNKTLTAINKWSIKNSGTRKPGNSGTNYPVERKNS